MGEEMVWVAHVTQLAEGVPVAAQVEGVELVVLKHNGTPAVFQGACPHQGTLLADGVVDKGFLICSGHGWRFDCASGQKADDPAVCLKRFPVLIEEGRIGVRKSEVRAWRQQAQQPGPLPASAERGRSLQDLPGPKGLPLIGNLHQLDMTQLHLILERWALRYGALFTFRMGAKQIVAVADPDLIHKVLQQRPEVYRRWGNVAPVFAEMGMNGIFSAEGEQWHRQRRVAMHALNTSHLRQFFPTLTKMTARLKARWERAAAARAAVEVQKDLMRFTVDVTTELAFGYDMNTLEEAGDTLHQHLTRIMPMLNRRVYAPFPYWHYVKLPADRALDNALAALHKIVADLISQSRTRLARNPELETSPSNFLEAMLAARDAEGKAFTEEEIFGNVLTMLLAGEDTTGNTMTWMAHFMSIHPEVQERMQREADEVLRNAPMLQHYPDHERLTYLEAVVQESLRLKSVGPLLLVEANHPTELDGVHLPAGTVVCLLTRLGGLQESAFAQAEQFRPERWLRGSEEAQHRHDPHAMMPFGSGPRFCPGRSLALLEIKAVMAMLCRNFTISTTATAQPVGEHLAFVMMPTNVSVNFRRREGLVSAQ